MLPAERGFVGRGPDLEGLRGDGADAVDHPPPLGPALTSEAATCGTMPSDTASTATSKSSPAHQLDRLLVAPVAPVAPGSCRHGASPPVGRGAEAREAADVEGRVPRPIDAAGRRRRGGRR